jgi:hypothetical protein
VICSSQDLSELERVILTTLFLPVQKTPTTLVVDETDVGATNIIIKSNDKATDLTEPQ